MTSRKSVAINALNDTQVLQGLERYSPQVVSTLFVDLDIAGSDLDIICCYLQAHEYLSTFNTLFSSHDNYRLAVNPTYILGSFDYAGLSIEVYASTEAVEQQLAFRHYKIMERLVANGGEYFCSQVRKLKRDGYKTEPAICRYLSLSGDPYKVILDIEQWSEETTKCRLQCAELRSRE